MRSSKSVDLQSFWKKLERVYTRILIARPELKNHMKELKKVGLGRRHLKTLTFELVIRNNSKAAINLTLEDQIPITENEEIEIKLLQNDGASFNEVTGKLTWTLALEPGEKRTVKFSYSIEHEKDKPIS